MEEKEFLSRVMCHRDAMWSIAKRLGLDDADAADAVQETVIALWKAKATLQEGPVLKNYCITAVRNRCIDLLKRNTRFTAFEETTTGEPAEEPPPETSGPSQTEVERMMRRLPPPQAAVFRMSCFGEMDNKEIARATGYREANVRQILSRARRRLRDLLTGAVPADNRKNQKNEQGNHITAR